METLVRPLPKCTRAARGPTEARTPRVDTRTRIPGTPTRNPIAIPHSITVAESHRQTPETRGSIYWDASADVDHYVDLPAAIACTHSQHHRWYHVWYG